MDSHFAPARSRHNAATLLLLTHKQRGVSLPDSNNTPTNETDRPTHERTDRPTTNNTQWQHEQQQQAAAAAEAEPRTKVCVRRKDGTAAVAAVSGWVGADARVTASRTHSLMP